MHNITDDVLRVMEITLIMAEKVAKCYIVYETDFIRALSDMIRVFTLQWHKKPLCQVILNKHFISLDNYQLTFAVYHKPCNGFL